MDFPITTAPCGSEGVTIAVTCADGACRVLFTYTRRFDKLGNVTWEVDLTPEYIEEQINKVYAAPGHSGYLPVQKWRILPGEEQKHGYTGAWQDDDKGPLKFDMPKAREIHRNWLRRDRALAFVELDAAYLRADEAGDKSEKERIAAEKQRLRDITRLPAIEAATTIDELKAIEIT
jgi:hypothetical protein